MRKNKTPQDKEIEKRICYLLLLLLLCYFDFVLLHTIIRQLFQNNTLLRVFPINKHITPYNFSSFIKSLNIGKQKQTYELTRQEQHKAT